MASKNYLPTDVAVVIPLSARDTFTKVEKIALRQADKFLRKYDRYLVCPEHNPISWSGCEKMVFPEKFFGSVRAHNTLMLSRSFYERFSGYSYILIYHLDSLVFRDEMLAWCEKDYDYIGAPWIYSGELPWLKTEGVGNGGFSLRKVRTFLDVLRSKIDWIDYDLYWKNLGSTHRRMRQLLLFPKWILKCLGHQNRVRHHIASHIARNRNEDWFWAFEARKYLPSFKIAPVDEALHFAFEYDPRLCLTRTDGKLPFGCHAWERHRDFWEPHLLTSPGVDSSSVRGEDL